EGDDALCWAVVSAAELAKVRVPSRNNWHWERPLDVESIADDAASPDEELNWTIVLARKAITDQKRNTTRSSGPKPADGGAELAVPLEGQLSRESIKESVHEMTFVERIDRGQFGEVWKAKDQFGRIVAVKFIHGSRVDESSPFAHAQALARAEHPNVVTL